MANLKCIAFFLFGCVLAVYGASNTTPQYAHLALTGNPTQMNVGWYTETNTTTSTVKWGSTSKLYTAQSLGTSNQWKSGYGYNHFAVMTNLVPGESYYYVVGDSKGGWSEEYTFSASPDTSVPFKVGVYGDMGTDNVNNTLERILNRTKNGDWDWIFHVGDISYADDHVFEFQQTWNLWFDMVSPITPIMPYMVAPGNHEYTSYDPTLYEATKNFIVYNARFMMPNANSQSKSMYYSFDYSYVHWVVYSTESSFPDAPYGDATDYGDEISWLQEDLAKANENRANIPWIIVIGHRPIYSSSKGFSKNGVPIDEPLQPSNSATLQKLFEPIFYQYGVDMIINGHVHSYERCYPTYNNTVTNTNYHNPPSPFSIVIGNAGNIEGLEDGSSSDWEQPAPSWSAYRFGSDYGYAIMTVYNETSMNWQFFSSADNILRDEITVYNDKHLQPIYRKDEF